MHGLKPPNTLSLSEELNTMKFILSILDGPSMKQVTIYSVNTNIHKISNPSKQKVKQLMYNGELSICLAGKQINSNAVRSATSDLGTEVPFWVFYWTYPKTFHVTFLCSIQMDIKRQMLFLSQTEMFFEN